jgi:hypothetical protein
LALHRVGRDQHHSRRIARKVNHLAATAESRCREFDLLKHALRDPLPITQRRHSAFWTGQWNCKNIGVTPIKECGPTTELMPEQVVHLDQVLGDEPAAPASGSLDAVDEQLIARLVGRAREGRLQLTGEGGLLAQLTKRLVESALEGEITDHLGYDWLDPPPVGTAGTPATATDRRRC